MFTNNIYLSKHASRPTPVTHKNKRTTRSRCKFQDDVQDAGAPRLNSPKRHMMHGAPAWTSWSAEGFTSHCDASKSKKFSPKRSFVRSRRKRSKPHSSCAVSTSSQPNGEKQRKHTHLDQEMDNTVFKTILSFSFCCQERESNAQQQQQKTLAERKSVDRKVRSKTIRGRLLFCNSWSRTVAYVATGRLGTVYRLRSCSSHLVMGWMRKSLVPVRMIRLDLSPRRRSISIRNGRLRTKGSDALLL